MMNIFQKRYRFLTETANHFNLSNRGTNHRGWVSFSAGCAIGRLIPDKDLCAKLDVEGLWSYSPRGPINFKMIPVELQELGEDFLIRIQLLHDRASYWNTTGLSESGVIEMNLILTDFCVDK